MIRHAEPKDMPRLLDMGERFVSESEYAALIQIDREQLERTIRSVATNPEGAILVSENGDGITGMIALLIFAHPYSGERMASELVWWVDPEHRGGGLRLLKAAEEWARDKGAARMQMVAPNEQVGALYRRLGYAPVETAFQRSL